MLLAFELGGVVLEYSEPNSKASQSGKCCKYVFNIVNIVHVAQIGKDEAFSSCTFSLNDLEPCSCRCAKTAVLLELGSTVIGDLAIPS